MRPNNDFWLFSKEEINYLNEKQNISICVDPNFLPYEQITKEGKYVGIVSDIVKQLSQNTNIKFQLNVTKSWNESFEMVKNKESDEIFRRRQKPPLLRGL